MRRLHRLRLTLHHPLRQHRVGLQPLLVQVGPTSRGAVLLSNLLDPSTVVLIQMHARGAWVVAADQPAHVGHVSRVHAAGSNHPSIDKFADVLMNRLNNSALFFFVPLHHRVAQPVPGVVSLPLKHRDPTQGLAATSRILEVQVLLGVVVRLLRASFRDEIVRSAGAWQYGFE